MEYKISPLIAVCRLFNKELFNIRKDLVKSGNGDMFMQEIIKGMEIQDFHINTDNEIYVKFKNGDVLSGGYI